MLPVKIAGLGWYLPSRRVTNAQLEEQLGISASWIERATGVRERRYVTTETTLSMATAATHMALEDAGLQPRDLDAIICASSAPQQTIPCTAAFLQRAISAPDGASACFDLNATCLSFLFALQTLVLPASTIRCFCVVANRLRSPLIPLSVRVRRSLGMRRRRQFSPTSQRTRGVESGMRRLRRIAAA